MKVLHINSYYVSDEFYTNLYNYQSKNNIDYDVFVHKAKGTFVDFNKDNTICVSCYNKIDKLFFNRKHNKIYKELVRNEIDYDLVHAHTLFSNGMLAYKLFNDFKINYIVAVRSTDVNFFFKYFIHLRKKGLKILLSSKRIVLISKSYKEKLFKYIPKKYQATIESKIVIIPNGVNDYWLENISLSKCTNNTVLHVAKINKNKNALTICKAIQLLNNNGYNFTLNVVGKIEDDKIYKKLLDYNFVNHQSFIPKEQLIEYYRNSKLFVLVSYKETYGISYLEAMSQGLPLIYSKNEGFDNQFEEGFVGYSVESNDYIDLSNKMLEIIKKENYNRIRVNCLDTISEFNWAIIGGMYTSLYNEII